MKKKQNEKNITFTSKNNTNRKTVDKLLKYNGDSLYKQFYNDILFLSISANYINQCQSINLNFVHNFKLAKKLKN